MKSDKFWFAILGGIIVVSLITALLLSRAPANLAYIRLNGELIRIIDLSAVTDPYSLTIECGSGYNVISVRHGSICIADADCPDGLCVRQGWSSGGAIPLVCLPHRLVISTESNSPPGVDAITG